LFDETSPLLFIPIISFDHPPLPLQGGDFSFLKKILVAARPNAYHLENWIIGC
jgi:hypothetical protein